MIICQMKDIPSKIPTALKNGPLFRNTNRLGNMDSKELKEVYNFSVYNIFKNSTKNITLKPSYSSYYGEELNLLQFYY